MYYVCGWFDTQGKIDIKGVTKSVQKARIWVENEKKRTEGMSMHGHWPDFKQTTVI